MNWKKVALGIALSGSVFCNTVTTTEEYRIALIGTRIFRGQATLAEDDEVVTVTSIATVGSLSSADTAIISNCAFINKAYVCVNAKGTAGKLVPTPSSSSVMPQLYTDCHAHSSLTFCVDVEGSEYEFVTLSSNLTSGKLCHFHAGVEHCVGDDEHEGSCERVDRDYDIPLRIGLLFVMLVTGTLGVGFPIIFKKAPNIKINDHIFILVKQFGTGIIISTAFVHLLTHSFLMWNNSCITLNYESTGTAITMAGLLLAFLVDYGSSRLLLNSPKVISNSSDVSNDNSVDEKVSTSVQIEDMESSNKQEFLNVATAEAGIIFHSILIGITLVVAGDSSFITLFIVIVFHQFFEGIALGSRIAELRGVNALKKLIMVVLFALITPIGMAIGLGVLNTFNGNDPQTIIALGTLDSLSAGILVWTGVAQWWSKDWIQGEFRTSSWVKTATGFIGLLGGMILMSVLGKWA